MNSSAYARMYLNRQTQRGLSLVELMISITIGLLILTALTTLFVNQSRTRSELDKSNRMIDNGRYALEVLSENLRIAGFYGELDPSSVALPASITDPCSTTPADMTAAIRLHVGGYNAAMASPPCGLAASELKNGSDILVLRRANTADPVARTAATDGIHYIQVSNCQFDATPFIIGNNAGTSGAFNLSQRNCTAANAAPFADVRRFIVQTYFVSPNNNGTDGIPTLKRMEIGPAGTGPFIPTPLVEGIEYLQVEYGVDGDSDGVADSYVQTCAEDVTCWANVVSVKLYIIARNIEPTTGYTDTKAYSLGLAGSYTPVGGDRNFKRHAYTQVVRLVNPASRRD